MHDLEPLPPCPFHDKGRHELTAIVPADEAGWLTMFCGRCGCVRRMPASGPLELPPLDNLSAAEIYERTKR